MPTQTADELGAAAHQICPNSKATRDNIPVTITATVACGSAQVANQVSPASTATSPPRNTR